MPTVIHPTFAPVIGQNLAKERLSAGINSVTQGRAATQPLITAPFGCGKTEVAKRYLEALEAQGFRSMSLNSPKEMRLAGPKWDEFVQMVMDYTTPYVIHIDEAHDMVLDSVKNMVTLKAFLLKAMDKQNTGRDIPISDDLVTRFERNRNVFILTTNFPHLLDKSGALQSRFDHIQLDTYDEEELKGILVRMMMSNEMQWDSEEVLNIIARCGRGSARPIKNVIDEALIIHGNENPLTKAQALRTIRLLRMFPKGLTHDEVKLLQICQNKELKDSQANAMIPSMSPADLRNAKGYLTSPQVGFMTITSRGMETTRIGSAYLNMLFTQGFLE